MELVIPDGVPVIITIGHASHLALPYEPPVVVGPPARHGGRMVKTFLAGLLLVGVFQAGRFLPRRPDNASAAQPVALTDGTAASAAGEIPSAFRAQIARPPQVVPPPGAAAVSRSNSGDDGATPAAKTAPPNPFGLQG